MGTIWMLVPITLFVGIVLVTFWLGGAAIDSVPTRDK